jgi:hypothetical protein
MLHLAVADDSAGLANNMPLLFGQVTLLDTRHEVADVDRCSHDVSSAAHVNSSLDSLRYLGVRVLAFIGSTAP